jgi:sugar diacid utilization regulator
VSKIGEVPKDEQILEKAYIKMFLALEKGGFCSIAEAAFVVMKMPIIIVNAELKKLAQYPDKTIGDPIWDKYFNEQEMTPQMTWQLLEDSIIGDSEFSEMPVWLDRSLVEDIPRLVGNVRIDGVIEGYVGVLFLDREYSDIHVKLTKLICQTVAIEMQKDFHQRSSRNALNMAFISNLFKGRIKTQKEFSRWTESLKLTLSPRFCVVVTAGDREKTTLHYVKNIVDETEPSMYAVVIGDNLYILVTKLKDKNTPRDFLDTRVKQIEYLMSLYKLESGVSDIFDDISSIHLYKYQAEQALNVGRISRPEESIYIYNDIVLENIMFSVREHIELQNYVHPAIDTLRVYDKKNGTEYLKTLKIYITSMCRHHATIERLHIHRNTLLYRLKKIEELTGTSLEDERFCALLLCNFYLLNE